MTESQWPAINDLVWVRLPCCETAVHPSRVEDYADGNLVIAHPARPHQAPVALPEEGEIFLVGWRSGANATQVYVKLAGNSEGEVATWMLEAQGQAELVQRRRFVRAEWDAAVALYLPAETVMGRVIDFSEGGIRCSVPETQKPHTRILEVSFTMRDAPVVLHAEIAWWGEQRDGRVELGLQFIYVKSELADRLRAFVFEQQLRMRKKPSDLFDE